MDWTRQDPAIQQIIVNFGKHNKSRKYFILILASPNWLEIWKIHWRKTLIQKKKSKPWKMLFKIFCYWENFQQNFNPIKPHSLRTVEDRKWFLYFIKCWFISVPDLTLNSLLLDENAFKTDLSNFVTSRNVTITSNNLSQLIETNVKARSITRGEYSSNESFSVIIHCLYLQNN